MCEKLTAFNSINLIHNNYVCLSCLSKVSPKIKLITDDFGRKIYKELVKCAILNNLDISNVPKYILNEIKNENQLENNKEGANKK